MAILADNGPAGGEAKVGNTFSAVTEGPANLFAAEVGGAAPTATMRKPVPIFAVDLTRLRDAGAAALDEARRTGWRYLVEHEARLHAIDLPEGGEREPIVLAGDEISKNLAKAARKAAGIADPTIDYEPRILDLNLIGNSVLWLHSAGDPAADRFVSLAANPSEIKCEALLKRLQAAADRKLTALGGAGDEAGG